MKPFSIFVAGMCFTSALYNAVAGNAWAVLALCFVSAANLWNGRPAEKRVDA